MTCKPSPKFWRARVLKSFNSVFLDFSSVSFLPRGTLQACGIIPLNLVWFWHRKTIWMIFWMDCGWMEDKRLVWLFHPNWSEICEILLKTTWNILIFLGSCLHSKLLLAKCMFEIRIRCNFLLGQWSQSYKSEFTVHGTVSSEKCNSSSHSASVCNMCYKHTLEIFELL